jgi:hypothetical protein
MNYINFLGDALVLGRVLGVGPGSTEDAIESAWGPASLEDVHKRGRMKRWDYGLAEFSFRKDSEWVCTGFMVQVHRLAYHGNSIIPQSVASVYGEFPESVSFDTLAGALRNSGVNLEQEQAPGGGFDIYVVPGTRNRLYVNQEEVDTPREGCKPGDVWSISVQE